MPGNGFYYPGDTGPEGQVGSGGAMGDGGGIVGAVINAGAGMYDSYQNRKTSKENTNKTIAAQKAEAELAYQRSVQMWHLQNSYNTPEAQMARFKNAGLNPHLIYGQGSPGLVSSPPQYQPANMQYRYEAAQYGSSLQSILPTLMAVGSWMQNMRLSETQIQRGGTETERARQMIDYLENANPALLRGLQNRLDIFPYQKDALAANAERGIRALGEMEQEYRYKWGQPLIVDEPYTNTRNMPNSGVRKLQYMQEQSKTKLAEAKASWADFDITNPQAIIQLVLSGVMGMAGMTLRQSMSRSSSKRVQPRERPRGLNRSRMSRAHPDR